ncbi:methyltransferase [Acidiphilium sp. PA]|uniref:methyltransferase n=1 Tax=Acidiphilium sp. PA TaxID=2871705 RepID=UPI002243831F|nr:methyltransferase [Acidiphilium sp. PA]MCW8306067.1 methyltransferase [Acidiphilium sp. PA]
MADEGTGGAGAIADERGRMFAAVDGLIFAQMAGAICEIGLPDALGVDERATVGSLAGRLGCDEGGLFRLVRALAAQGVLTIDADRMVGHSAASRVLRRDEPHSLAWFIRYWTMPSIWAAWGGLSHCVRTGAASFPVANGRGFFEHLDAHAEEHRVFSSLMSVGFAGRHAAMAAGLSFAAGEIVVDVGGGAGSLLREILLLNPGVRGVLYDLPSVVVGAGQYLDTEDLRARCVIEAGSFLEGVPQGGTSYVLSWILHDWPDAAAIAILKAVRAAMTPGARLIVIEEVLAAEAGAGDADTYVNDLNMLVLFGGCERTMAGFDALMAAAGFGPVRRIGDAGGMAVLEARGVDRVG